MSSASSSDSPDEMGKTRLTAELGKTDETEQTDKLTTTAHLPIVFSGVQKLYDDLYDEKKLPRTCSIVSRMDEFQMKGMTRKDAGIYLTKVSEYENFMLTYPAQQALIATALNETIGGINAFVTVLGRCITMARAAYFTSDGRTRRIRQGVYALPYLMARNIPVRKSSSHCP